AGRSVLAAAGPASHGARAGATAAATTGHDDPVSHGVAALADVGRTTPTTASALGPDATVSATVDAAATTVGGARALAAHEHMQRLTGRHRERGVGHATVASIGGIA